MNMAPMNKLARLLVDIEEMAHLPRVHIDLLLRETRGNDPFYARMVREFYGLTQTRHRKFPLVRHWQYGVALCRLPSAFDE